MKVSADSGPNTAYVGLGSNLGDRLGCLREAVARFRAHASTIVTKVSPVYETKAHTLGDEQPAYLNAVIELRTTLAPEDLLALCHAIEQELGRDRFSTGRWTPRTLDLDVLIFGQVTLGEKDLTLPHPRMAGRRFVLRPLADVNPDLIVPAPYGVSVRQLFEACPDPDVPVRTDHTLSQTGE